MSLLVKVHLLGADQEVKVIRKIEMHDYFNYNNLEEKVRGLFNLPQNKLCLFYKDEDGDMVMFMTDDELWIGQRSKKGNTFSIYVRGCSPSEVFKGCLIRTAP